MTPFHVNNLAKVMAYISHLLGPPAGLQISDDEIHRRFVWIDEHESEDVFCTVILSDEASSVELVLDHNCPRLLQIIGWCAMNHIFCVVDDTMSEDRCLVVSQSLSDFDDMDTQPPNEGDNVN